MPTDKARRIVHYVDDLDMSFGRLAQQLDCNEREAQLIYAKAKSVAQIADARRAVSELRRLAVELNVSTYDMLAMFA